MKIFAFIWLLFLPIFCFSQNTFFHTYYDTTNNWPGDILVLESGNILLPVLTQNDTSWFPMFYKFNPAGEIIKKKTIPNNSQEFSKIKGFHLCDDGYLLGFGSKGTGINYIHDLWVIKIDTSFNTINENHYQTGLPAIRFLNPITDSYGDIVLFCSSGDPITSTYNFIFRLNQDGDSLYAKIYNNHIPPQFAMDILQAQNNSGYYLFSFWNQFGTGEGHVIVKIDNNFEIIGAVGQTYNSSNNAADWYSDTSYIVSGQKMNSYSDTIYKTGVTIVDTSGNIINEYYWGGPDTIYQPTAFNNLGFHDGHIYYGGTYNIHIPPVPDDVTWLILNKLDSDLNPVWQKFIGGDRFYILFSINTLDDGSCLLAGHTVDFLNGDDKMAVFLAKVGSNGEFLSSPETPKSLMEVKLYPNPGHDYFMLDVRLPEYSNRIELYDMNGRHCLSQEIDNGSNTINTQSLPTGMYVFKIVGKKKELLSGKWVKE